MSKDNREVEKDISTIKQKYIVLNDARIAKRTRNTLKSKVLTLKSDGEYLKLLLKPKIKFATRTGENKRYKQKVLTDYFKDSSKNLYILQSNFSLEQPINLIGTGIKQYPEMAAALYVATNSKFENETGTKNTIIKKAEVIQLSRYDHYQSFDHNNRIYNNPLKLSYFKAVIPKGIPHFHFGSKTQALAYDDTAGCDAISLNDLIIYIQDLIKAEEDDDLLKDNFSMPYLEIKKRPELYKTSSDLMELKDYIDKNKIITKSMLFNITDCRQDIYGLKAVLFDLILLSGLRDSVSPVVSTLLATKIAVPGLAQSIEQELITKLIKKKQKEKNFNTNNLIM